MKELETWTFHLSVIFYLLTALWSVGYFVWNRQFRLTWGQRFLLAGFLSETIALMARGFSTGQPPIFSRFEFMVVVVWALVACCLVMSYRFKVRMIIPIAMPVIAILFTLITVADFNQHGVAPESASGKTLFERLWLSFHVGALMLSIGCFVVSFGTAFLYLTQQRRLKGHRLSEGWASRLPSLEKLDRLSFGSVAYGHLLLTIGMVLATVLGSEQILKAGPGGSLIWWSITVWVMYAVLLLIRWRMLMGQRMIALLTVFMAVFATLAYPAIRFLLAGVPTVHKLLS